MHRGFHNSNNLNLMAQQASQQNKVKISVRGWQNATQQDLVNFVSRKTRIAISDSYIEGQLVIGFVNSKQDADALLKWNGVRFAGNSLKFEIIGDNNSGSGTSSTITLLKNVLYRRYNPQTKMLDLGNLHNDPDLVTNGLFSSMSTQSKMFPALMKLASKEPQLIVESINLSNNSLKDINGISTLAQTYPNLKNLCLANNQISKFRSLEVWKNKFKELRELLMMNNPITADALYRAEMLRLFPKLVILDNILVRDEVKLQSIYSLPVKNQQFFFEDNNLGQSSTDFVTNFLNLWDTNRPQLMGLYTAQSQFSVSVDSSVPSISVPNSDQTPTFGYYLPLSRNIIKVSSEKTKQQRLAMGQESIDSVFKSLPNSKHFLLEQPSQYSVEAWSYLQVQGFIITLHGFYEETGKPEVDANKPSTNTNSRNRRFNHGYNNNANNKLGRKSFDRTWVIVPNQGGVIIASDLLTIRPYVDGAWMDPQVKQQVSPAPVQAMQTPVAPIPAVPLQQPASTLQLPPDVQAKLNQMQLELVNKLHQETKLNAQYTFMLAEQSGWNYDVAIKGFQGSMANLPREAFI